ncbi:MAG: TolC family protein [Myxococcota bacterium]|nr:TolC family protein [Myxococcota bacterium]
MRLILAAGALIVATASLVARAETPAASDSGSGMTPALRGSLTLSLADAIAMGLENNLDIEVERHAPLIAEEDYQISWGAYDPILGGEAGFARDQPVTANPLFATSGTNERADGSAGLSGMVPILGATYAIDFLGDRSDSLIFIQPFSPQYTSDLSFSGSLPLLRGLVWNQAWTGIRTSDALRDEVLENFRANVMNAVLEIETRYWELVASREQLGVAHKSLETANALLDQVETQYEVGVVSRVEVVEAEAGVADRDFRLIVAKNLYRTAQDDLIDVVLGSHFTAASTLEFDPTEAPESYTIYQVDVPQAVEIAFRQRPELSAARDAVERREIELRFRRNERLPQLDLRGRYGVEGLAGRNGTDFQTREPIPEAAAGSNFNNAPRSFFTSNDGSAWDVRAVLSVPIGNIAGRHGVSKAQLELHRSETLVKRLRQQIILQVRKSARDLLSGVEGVEAAERRRLAAAEQLRAERVRLEHGESTPFDVLQRESDLVDAESQKIGALRTYRLAEAELLRAQGTSLQARNVVFEEVAPLR